MQKAGEVLMALKKIGTRKRARASAWFFKTDPGHYGHGDVFVGVTVPEQRLIAKRYKDLTVEEIKKLLKNKIHECRLTALFILVTKFERGNEDEKRKIVKFYLTHTGQVNNWDLVDSSARQILGEYLSNKGVKDRKILYKLVKSKNLWNRRISIIATHAFIATGGFTDTMKISELLLGDKHDLIHKAVGWTLREVGKKSGSLLRKFLNKNIRKMPRTTLRYSIERFPEEERREFLQKGK